MPWLSQSPDLNPVEPWRETLDQHLRERFHHHQPNDRVLDTCRVYVHWSSSGISWCPTPC
jgi:hypothetical protein